ncbi:hypothetical protein KIW84_010658 [Lathyrus oleraceus]|uniref:Uncharacterized protein n=1 Tax=Pisum sativum TaxID=3888 RepID=A0A9D5BE80_PEA|nr:hypothetical protein KIW84_010658 [Pisum sativum]
MASLSMVVTSSCIKSTCGKGEWFHYKSVACIQEEDYHIENGDSYREARIQEQDYHNGVGDSCREGDDDDGDYDYAPAA